MTYDMDMMPLRDLELAFTVYTQPTHSSLFTLAGKVDLFLTAAALSQRTAGFVPAINFNLKLCLLHLPRPRHGSHVVGACPVIRSFLSFSPFFLGDTYIQSPRFFQHAPHTPFSHGHVNSRISRGAASFLNRFGMYAMVAVYRVAIPHRLLVLHLLTPATTM